MSIAVVIIRILIAAILGGAIGVEREIREHTAGFRTHLLVAVGAAAFTLASFFHLAGTSYDPNRISAQIVTGIGFLGAGAIIRYGTSVRGLTTAASLWTVAAVGLLTGQGFYTAAIVTTAVVIISLYALRTIEERIFHPMLGTPIGIVVEFRSTGYVPLTKLLSLLSQRRVTVVEFGHVSGEDDQTHVHLFLKLPRGMNPGQLLELIAHEPEVRTISVD
jgi:putative Mg2+ transporter-C (MgtC) family protein